MSSFRRETDVVVNDMNGILLNIWKWVQQIEFLFQIITLLRHTDAFSTLSESKIEGIEPFAARFQQILGTIKKKPYDILDQRKVDFDNDFEDFCRLVGELEVGTYWYWFHKSHPCRYFLYNFTPVLASFLQYHSEGLEQWASLTVPLYGELSMGLQHDERMFELEYTTAPVTYIFILYIPLHILEGAPLAQSKGGSIHCAELRPIPWTFQVNLWLWVRIQVRSDYVSTFGSRIRGLVGYT